MDTPKTAIDQVEDCFKAIEQAVLKYASLRKQFSQEVLAKTEAFLQTPTDELANELSDLHSLESYMRAFDEAHDGDRAAEMEEVYVVEMYTYAGRPAQGIHDFVNDLTDKMWTILGEETYASGHEDPDFEGNIYDLDDIDEDS